MYRLSTAARTVRPCSNAYRQWEDWSHCGTCSGFVGERSRSCHLTIPFPGGSTRKLHSAIVVALIASYIDRRTAFGVLAGLCAWFLYVGLMGYFGVVKNTAMRPRIILGTQYFRIGVELFLHQLWLDGLVPKMLTFEGANVDIYVGVSALLIAWLSTRGRAGVRFGLAWNALGLLSLANVVIRAVLTAPGPFDLIRAEVPNRMIGTFPFLFIPGFFVPLAVVLHLVAIRAISEQPSTAIAD
jgi:hypothetical protein